VDELRRADIEAWTTKVALWIRDGKPSIRRPGFKETLSPRTANGWLRILRTICHAARVKCELPKSAFEGIAFFEEPRAYTKELPNAVPPTLVSKFLEKAKELAPNHYAMMMLGFVTGLRPSSLRTLRRHGLERDVLWDEGVILVRRSNSRGVHIMDQTKTGHDLELCLPPVMMDVLRAHVAALPPGPMRDSEYLFPSITGGMRARTVLLKPFRDIGKALGLGDLTPRAMRRTFNDGARAAQLHDVVTRSISGHQTEQMQRHYSTAQADEQREELAKVYSLMVDGQRGVKRGVKDAVG
jgi:integrase